MTGIITAVEDEERLGSIEVIALAGAGCSYRKLDYWTRRRFVRSSQPRESSGVPRSFTLTEARIVMLITRLSVHGIEVETAAEAARMMIENETLEHPLGQGIILRVDALPDLTSS